MTKSYIIKIRTLLLKFCVIAVLLVVVAPNAHAQSGGVSSQCQPGTGTLPSTIFVPWYKYLEGEGVGKDCKPKFAQRNGNTDYTKSISLIALAVLDTLTRISGIIATALLIWGSIQYITSQGEPNGISSAKNTITNAVIGLVIVLLAIGLVQFIGNAASGV